MFFTFEMTCFISIKILCLWQHFTIIDKMSLSYRMLYEIENSLRKFISKTNYLYYGLSWINFVRPPINLHTSSYFDLVNHLINNPVFNSRFNKPGISQLIKLIQARNQVCHLRTLTEEELILLKNCHFFVLKLEWARRLFLILKW